VAGSLTLHAQLEERLASFFHTEAAVLFSSGYLANLGALSALLRRGDLVLADRLAHASLIDACRTSGATFRIFHHNDASHVARLLERYPSGRRRFVVTEGVFSMEGDRAPLRQLLDVAQTYGAFLYVDDAHGAFVTGSSGRGSPEAAGVPHARLIYMGTLGKALGCQGGFVAGPQPLIGSLHNRARQFIYSTALAVPVAAAALEALRLVEADGRPRARLARHVERLHARLSAMQTISALGQLRDRPASHIVPIVVGSSKHACQVSSRLMDRGIFAPAIRPPTVPEGTARLRISLTALHTSAQLNQLADALQDALLVDGNGTRHAARHLRHGN
jgi:glycine C-acetyltransferase/8-amino-7-oxononanoate synthase